MNNSCKECGIDCDDEYCPRCISYCISKISDSKLEEVNSLSQVAYIQTCKEIGYSNDEIWERCLNMEMSEDDFIEKREALGIVYRKHICELPTNVLNNMLAASESSQRTIAPKTTNSITTELLERELNKGC